jgi:hypothetical protein
MTLRVHELEKREPMLVWQGEYLPLGRAHGSIVRVIGLSEDCFAVEVKQTDRLGGTAWLEINDAELRGSVIKKALWETYKMLEAYKHD